MRNQKNEKKDLLPEFDCFEEYELFKSNLSALEALAKRILLMHQLPVLELSLFSEGTNIVFEHGKDQVIKIYPPFHHSQYHSDWLVLQHLQDRLSIHTPKLQYHGEYEGWPYIIMSKLDGCLLETLWENMAHDNKLIIMRELGALINEVHALPTAGLEAIDSHWESFIERQMTNCVTQHQTNQLPKHLLEQIPAYIALIKNKLPPMKSPVLLTGEYTPMNFLVKERDGFWYIDGLIDFGDAMLGLPEYDLLGPGAFLIQGDKGLLRESLISYGYSSDELTESLSQQLMGLMLLHQYSNLNVQVRIEGWQACKTLKELEHLVWGFASK